MKARFCLKSFDQDLLEEALEELTPILANMEAQVSRVVSLPSHIRRFCVIRSPHIDKDSREHFEVELSKQFFDIVVENPENLNLLLQANLPAGVSCFIRILNF